MTEQRILFMSESNMLLHLFEENLDNEMYEIEVLDCEIKGVESVEELHPDLILLDVEDEEQQKRWDFLKVVKHHDATANIPVLLCTDESLDLREQERDFQMLNIRLLYKPFNKEDLLAALRQIVQPFSSAAKAADEHKRNISMLRGTTNLLSAFAHKFFPGWTPSFVAWAKQRFDEEVQGSHTQEQADKLEAEERQGQEQENLLESIERPEESLEKEAEELPEQEGLPAEAGQVEVQKEKDVEVRQEQEEENVPVPEERLLSVAR